MIPSAKIRVLKGESFHSSAVKELGYVLSSHSADCYITRWFDHSRNRWHKQTFLGIPITGLMERGLSVQIPSGCGGRYLPTTQGLESLFGRQELLALLGELRYSGPVSLLVSSADGLVSQIETRLPSWGVYNVLEGVPGTIGEFFSDPLGTVLQESWTLGVLVSRWPFPKETINGGLTTVGGVSADVERHLWLMKHEKFKDTIKVYGTAVGIVTAWGKSLWDCGKRVERTCRGLRVEEVQYRIDGADVCQPIYDQLSKSLNLSCRFA